MTTQTPPGDPTKVPREPKPCSACGEPQDRAGRYCRTCHNAYMRNWRKTSGGDSLRAAIRTLLPGLRARNYQERWATGSPAVQALTILSKHVGETPEAPGTTVDPDVPSAYPTPPEGTNPMTDTDRLRREVADLKATLADGCPECSATAWNRASDLRRQLADSLEQEGRLALQNDALRATITRVNALRDVLTPITGEYHAVVATQHLLPPCIACLILEQLRAALKTTTS